MRLNLLPDDVLARICSFLHRVDHHYLARVCTSLGHLLRPANASFWQDVLRLKYGSTVQRGAFRIYRAHDDACDTLCFTGAWKKLLSSTTCHPIAVSSENMIYVSDDKTLALFDLHGNKLRETNVARKTNSMAVYYNSGACGSSSDDNMIALGWDKAVSVYNNDLETTRPLRGHTSTVRSICFISQNLLASGSDGGAIRIHDPKTRRTRSVLRAHAGSVVQMEIIRRRYGTVDNNSNGEGDVKMLSRAGERVIEWDMATEKPIRKYVGGKFVYSISDYNTLYALSPGDGSSIRVYDSRVAGVSAILSLPRKWSNDSSSRRQIISDFSVAPNDAIVASVGDGGIAHWPSSGSWEGRILAPQRSLRGRKHAPILLRNNSSFAVTTSTGLPGDDCLFVAARLLIGDDRDNDTEEECIVKTVWPDREGGAFSKLENFHRGNKVLATREKEILLFDCSRAGAEIDWERLGGADIDIEDDNSYYENGRRRFWCVNTHEGDEYI